MPAALPIRLCSAALLAGLLAASLAASPPPQRAAPQHPTSPGPRLSELEELDPGRLGLRWSVDGEPAGDLLEATGFRCWTSRSVDSAVEARVVRTAMGTLRWTRRGVQTWTGADDGHWTGSLAAIGRGAECLGEVGTDLLPVAAKAGAPGAAAGANTTGASAGSEACPGRNLRLAVIVDPRLVIKSGGIELAAAHVATTLTFTAQILERDAGILVTEAAVDLQTQLGGPWDLAGMDCPAAISLAAGTWADGLPGAAHFGLLLSGEPLACSQIAGPIGGPSAFGICASLSGPDPVPGGPVDPRAVTWDLFSVAHTLGHALGAGHAGDYCPPLELCAPPQYFGPCQEERDCSLSGTLMGACHLCPGGIANLEGRFHPVVAAGLRAHAAEHLPALPAAFASVPDRVEPGVPLSISLSAGPQLAPPVVLFRYASGQPWFERPMSPAAPQTPGAWQAVLPAGQCGETFELRFSLQDVACGPALLPDGAAGPTTVDITRLEALVSQGFESPNGWHDDDLGASGGHWQWAVPLPAGLASPFAPTVPASGQACYVTGAHGGDSDVDGGTVALESPVYDLAPGPFEFRYAYYLGLSNPSPGDSLRVEARSNATGGVWHGVATHLTPAVDSTHWRWHSVPSDLLQSLGLGGPGTQVRFLATDGDAPSLVEAAIDDFELSGQACFF